MLAFGVSARAQCERGKLTASNAATMDFFGEAVAISGNTAVVGAPLADLPPVVHGLRTDAGRAYVYVRSGNAWTQQAMLSASDAGAGDNFGNSVAIVGDTIVVGAKWNDNEHGTRAGAAYVYARSGSTWTYQAKLMAADGAGSDFFGTSVSITTDGTSTYVLAGSPGDSSGTGAAYVFVRPSGLTVWTQQAKLTAGDAATNDQFGTAVAISGPVAVMGAPLDDRPGLTDAGAAYVFRHNGSWAQEAKFTDSAASSGDSFGQSVDVSGEEIIVGAPNAELGSLPNSGLAYVYRYRVFPRGWMSEGTLVANFAHTGDALGAHVAISGDVALLAKAGPATVQVSRYINGFWYPGDDLISSAVGGANFGSAVALDGHDAIIGADIDNAGAVASAGAAYSFVVGEEGANDCINASVVGAGSFRGCIVGATPDGSAGCGDSAGPDVWYSFTAPVCGMVRLDMVGSEFDTVLSIHAGCPGTSANQVACNDDSVGLLSMVDIPVVAARTYLVRVSGYANATGRYQLNIAYHAPANDACASATPVDAGTYSGSTCGATTDGAAGCVGGSGSDLWFAYTPACAGSVRFDTIGSSFDTVLSVHTGCPGTAANTIACNDDAGGSLTSLLTAQLAPGQTYVVRVAGYSAATGIFVLNIVPQSPVNDLCTNATTILAGAHPFSNCFATTDGSVSGGCQALIRSDVWFRYTTPRNGPLTISTCGSSFDTALAVYADSCPGGLGTLQACEDNSCGLQARVTFMAQGGFTYRIRVGGVGGAQGPGVLVVACPADFNADGLVTSQDFFDFLTAFFQNAPGADVNGDLAVNSQDFFDFLAMFFAGC